MMKLAEHEAAAVHAVPLPQHDWCLFLDVDGTLLELADSPGGVAVDPALQPLLTDPSAGWTDQILCAYYGGEFLYTQRIAITKRFKYVFNGFDIDELYDLERDPKELFNVIGKSEYSKYADDMRARLYEMMAKVEDPYGLPPTWHQAGNRPNRYGAPRYLPQGKRLT